MILIRLCRRPGTFLLVLLALLALSEPAHAQNWSFDGRTIALGGVGSTGNLATKMIDEQRDYTPIVIPFGIFQVLSDIDVFDPDSSTFDPIRAVEYVASPLHYVVDRSTANSGQAAFVNDVRNARLSRDLSKYKGFVPANDLLAEGLVAPNFGYTIKVRQDSSGGFQGVYVGAGPYLSLQTSGTIDPGLTTVLATGVNARNANFPIIESDKGQLALAVTGGYRGRFAWPAGVGSGSAREGLYVAANYNYLRGFGYLSDDLTVRFLTNGAGLIVDASNIVINHREASEGSGLAIDVGLGAVIDRWEFGAGANGIANRIDWSSLEQKTLTLASLTSGDSDFRETTTIAAGDTRVELPVDYRGNVGYHTDRWSAVAEVGHGFGGGSFHGGLERRFNRIELRGGGRYTFEKWNPTGGIGFNLSPKISVDVAAFGTHTNIERKRQLAIAASLRFNHMN